MSLAGTPCSASQARRWTIVRVLPLPAPAMTRTGPSGAVTASSWAGLSVEMSITGTPWEEDASGCRAAARTHAFRRAGEIALRAMPVRFASPPNGHAFAAPWGKFPRPRRNVLETVFRFGTLRRLRERQAPSSPGWFREKVFPIKTQTPPKHKSFGGGKRIFAFGCPSPVLRAFKARCGNACPVSTGKAGNRDSIKAKVFEEDGGGASPSGSLEGEGKRGRTFLRKFPLPPPISYSFPASSSSQRLSPVRSEPWG